MPFALPCGHTFCHRCLARLRAGDLFQCPNRCPLPDEVEVEDPGHPLASVIVSLEAGPPPHPRKLRKF